MKKTLRIAHVARQWLTAFVVFSFSLCPSAHAAGPKYAKPAGQPVTVTPEMVGAGIVSSGVSAAADPAGHRLAREAGARVGRAAALSDRHRRPAQQPPDRDRAGQAHRLGISLARTSRSTAATTTCSSRPTAAG